jgi:hypothetical protein
LTFESHHVSQQAQAGVAANTKIEPTRRLTEQFNPSEQPRDGHLEETSGGGRTKRVRWAAGQPGSQIKAPGRAGVIPGQPAGLNPESGDDQREIPGSR